MKFSKNKQKHDLKKISFLAAFEDVLAEAYLIFLLLASFSPVVFAALLRLHALFFPQCPHLGLCVFLPCRHTEVSLLSVSLDTNRPCWLGETWPWFSFCLCVVSVLPQISNWWLGWWAKLRLLFSCGQLLPVVSVCKCWAVNQYTIHCKLRKICRQCNKNKLFGFKGKLFWDKSSMLLNSLYFTLLNVFVCKIKQMAIQSQLPRFYLKFYGNMESDFRYQVLLSKCSVFFSTQPPLAFYFFLNRSICQILPQQNSYKLLLWSLK